METKYRVDERTIEECVKGKDGSYEFFRTEGVFGALKKRDLGREVNRVLFETSSVSTDSAFISEQIVNLAGFYDAIQRTNSTIEDVVALGSTAAGKAESEYFNSLYSFKAAVECCLHEFRTYIDARRKKIKQEKHTQSSSFTVQDGSNSVQMNRSNLLQAYKPIVALSADTEDLFGKTYRFFEYLNFAVQRQFESAATSLAKEFFRQHHIDIRGVDVYGVSGIVKRDSEFSYPILDYYSLVGVEVAAKVMRGAVNFTAFYDPVSQRNLLIRDDVKAKPKVILLRGRPGSGKSDLCKIAAANMKRIADKKGMRFKFISVSNAVKNKYYGESGANIRSMLNEALDPNTLSLILFDDVEMVLSNRKDSHSGADNEILHEAMTWLDGAGMQQYRGQYLVVMTSNFSERLDPAIKNRCTQNVEVPGPTVAEHYIQQLKGEMKDYLGHMDLTEREWKEVGSLCENITKRNEKIKINGASKGIDEILRGTTLNMEDIRLSGRDINKVCEISKNYIQGTDEIDKIPDEMLLLPADAQEKALKKGFRRLDAKKLKEIIIDRYEGAIKERLKEAEEMKRQVGDRFFIETLGMAEGKRRLEDYCALEEGKHGKD
jgi:SpoVK/Ycf46/Vps4 family AAA+-type ATPase